MESFRHFASDSGNLTRHALFGAAMFQDQPGFARQTLLQHNQRAVIADAESDCVKGYWFPLQRDMNAGAHAQKHAVAAATLFTCRNLRSGRR